MMMLLIIENSKLKQSKEHVRRSDSLLLGRDSIGSTHKGAGFGGNKSTHDTDDLEFLVKNIVCKYLERNVTRIVFMIGGDVFG